MSLLNLDENTGYSIITMGISSDVVDCAKGSLGGQPPPRNLSSPGSRHMPDSMPKYVALRGQTSVGSRLVLGLRKLGRWRFDLGINLVGAIPKATMAGRALARCVFFPGTCVDVAEEQMD
jgi:hypothetical protein